MSNSTVSACPLKRPTYLRERSETIETARGVVLFVHGLNNNDSIFAQMEVSLAEAGYHAVVVTLAGHDGTAADKHCASPMAWKQNVQDAFRYVQQKYPMLPVFGVGYSLGGVVLTAVSIEQESTTFAGLVLLAPALAIHPYTQVVRAFFPLAALNISLPSMAPAQYSAYRSTSVTSYQSLFRLRESVVASMANAKNIPPAYVLIHRFDELVSPSGLQELIEQHTLSNWTLHATDMEKIISEYNYHHLFAPEAFGEAEWLRYMREIRIFLDTVSGG